MTSLFMRFVHAGKRDVSADDVDETPWCAVMAEQHYRASSPPSKGRERETVCGWSGSKPSRRAEQAGSGLKILFYVLSWWPSTPAHFRDPQFFWSWVSLSHRSAREPTAFFNLVVLFRLEKRARTIRKRRWKGSPWRRCERSKCIKREGKAISRIERKSFVEQHSPKRFTGLG